MSRALRSALRLKHSSILESLTEQYAGTLGTAPLTDKCPSPPRLVRRLARQLAHPSTPPPRAHHTAAYSTHVPEDWGRNTEFLGTPANHRELLASRPLSPHVFEIDSVTKPHYKMPLGAVSSITNRVTGVMLSVGAGAAGYVALTQGDLGTAIESFKEAAPLLVFPAKVCVSFPLTYHYLAGLRHMWWDHHDYGNSANRDNPLKYENVEQSSKVLLAGSSGLAFILSALL